MAGPEIAPLHVLAWKDALDAEGIELSVWRIHRKIGMSGGLFTNQLLRETAYRKQTNHIRPLPGGRELLTCRSVAFLSPREVREEVVGLQPGQMAGANPAVRPIVRTYGIVQFCPYLKWIGVAHDRSSKPLNPILERSGRACRRSEKRSCRYPPCTRAAYDGHGVATRNCRRLRAVAAPKR